MMMLSEIGVDRKRSGPLPGWAELPLVLARKVS
jgi:hypothetical protein